MALIGELIIHWIRRAGKYLGEINKILMVTALRMAPPGGARRDLSAGTWRSPR